MTRDPSLPIVVVDLNVLISGATSAQGAAWIVLQAWEQNHFRLAISHVLLRKLATVLTYPRILKLTERTQTDMQRFIEKLHRSAIVVAGTTPVAVSSDPEDNTVFACAIEAGATYIVSGDEHHVLSIEEYRGIQTIRPKDFVELVLPKMRRAA